jgi:cytochrome P450
MRTNQIAELDLTDGTLYRQGFPHDLFCEVRAAGAVHHHPTVRILTNSHDGEIDFWSIVAHAEIARANRDWQTFSAHDGSGIAPTLAARRGHTIVSMDPPEHSRLRRLISAGFTPRMIAELEAHVSRRADQIVGAAAERGDVEFVSEVAYLLPMHVIADIMGIPDDDRPWVFQRADTMLRALDPTSGVDPGDRLTAERDLFDYAQRLGAEKRDRPGDDIWTILTTAEIANDDGDPTSLSELELDMFFIILALAGSETTRNAISQGLMALVAHPDQMQLLRDDPSVLPSATDEMIRWASPVLYFGRTVTRDVEIGGVTIPRGDRVVLWYPSGNRDDNAFADPFRFDLRRNPNPHVSFGGGGPHYCLGANLAKKEVSVIMRALLDRFPRIEITGEPVWTGGGACSNVGVSVDKLPVRLYT